LPRVPRPRCRIHSGRASVAPPPLARPTRVRPAERRARRYVSIARQGSSAGIAAARMDRGALYAKHVLARAQWAAAQDAPPCRGGAWPYEPVSLRYRCRRGRLGGEGCVVAGRRRRWWRIAAGSIKRMRRVAGGCLSHGCSKVRMQPVVVSAAEDVRRVTGDTGYDARPDRTCFARRHLPRIVSASCLMGHCCGGVAR
jgi:hypothetical protein